MPKVRSGLTLNEHNGRLMLFGGIHDITWELDDLYSFNISKQVWELIDEDSSRRKEVPVSPSKDTSPSKSNRRPTRKVNVRGYSIAHKKSTYVKRNTSSRKDLQEQSQEVEGESRMGMTLAQSHQRTLEEKKVGARIG